MKDNIILSIIIPTKNSQKVISNCFESILTQDFKNLEVVIVDGKSSDETLQLINENYINKINVSIIDDGDKGLYDAINKGILKSSGEWIYVLGSDDTLHSCNVLSKIIEKLNHTSSSIVYGDVKICGDAGWAKDSEIYAGKFDLSKIVRQNICQQAIFYNRKVFNKYGLFNPCYIVCADWDFLLSIFYKEKMEYIPLIVADFNGGGTSYAKRDVNFEKDFISNIYKYFGFNIYKAEFSVHRKKIWNYANTCLFNLRFFEGIKLHFALFLQSFRLSQN